MDSIAYYSSYNTVNNEFPMVENWFLASESQAPFIQCWLEEYKKCILSKEPESFYADFVCIASAG